MTHDALTAPGEVLLPAAEEVHVWRARIRQLTSGWRLPDLPHDERERARRFRVEADRDRFTVARGLLRILIGRYLRLPSAELPIISCPGGRPVLGQIGQQLLFNISHSGDVAMLAFSCSAPPGVDVEFVDAPRNIRLLAEAFYGAEERIAFATLSAADQKTRLLQDWTRREAVGKALGVGIALDPVEYRRIVRARNSWTLADVPVAARYVASVAVPVAAAKVIVRDIDPELLEGWGLSR